MPGEGSQGKGPKIEHFDVLIIGAGISGIGAAVHLQDKCPSKSYAVLEARENLGGTWDLFKYPGIRSDSDMFTLGYSFRPWTASKAIADGPSILAYLKDTARVYGVDRKIRYNTRMESASWSSHNAICRSVMIQPGAMQFTRTQRGPSSRASDRVNPIVAALVAT